MSEAAFGPSGIFGKVPIRGDFVRVGATGDPFTRFDAFLTESIEWAEARAAASWAERFESAAVHAFVFRASGRASTNFLAGALAPSRDAAGRHFPLSVAAPFVAGPQLLAQPELLPLVLEPCWQASSDCLHAARSADLVDWSTKLPVLADASADQLAEERRSYGEWANELSVDELWALLHGPGAALEPAQLLELVYQTVRPFRGQEMPVTPLSLRVPLGAAGGAAVCFWLDFVRRVARWRSTLPSFFWSHDGEAGALFLCLGEPPKSTLAELWHPSGARDEVCDVTHPLAAGWSPSADGGTATWSAALSVSELLTRAESREH